MEIRPYDNTPSNWVHFMNTKKSGTSYTLSLRSNGLCHPESDSGVPKLELAQRLGDELVRFGYTPLWVTSDEGLITWDPTNNAKGKAWHGTAYKVSITEINSTDTINATTGLVDRSLGRGIPWVS